MRQFVAIVEDDCDEIKFSGDLATNTTVVEAKTLPEAWFLCVKEAYLNGREAQREVVDE